MPSPKGDVIFDHPHNADERMFAIAIMRADSFAVIGQNHPAEHP
jgi:hypothetical protein